MWTAFSSRGSEISLPLPVPPLCLAEPCHRMAEHSGAAKKQEMACSARCPTAAQNGYMVLYVLHIPTLSS